MFLNVLETVTTSLSRNETDNYVGNEGGYRVLRNMIYFSESRKDLKMRKIVTKHFMRNSRLSLGSVTKRNDFFLTFLKCISSILIILR